MSSLEHEFNVARQKVLSGTPLTIEEQTKLISMLRANRFAAAEAGGKARSSGNAAKKAKIGMSDEDLDASLADLGL